jgi:Phosphopantetheine attachment site.
VQDASDDAILFGSGINISSIAFTEFIMELEETYDLDIDLDALDESVKTVGQLYARLAEIT